MFLLDAVRKKYSTEKNGNIKKYIILYLASTGDRKGGRTMRNSVTTEEMMRNWLNVFVKIIPRFLW